MEQRLKEIRKFRQFCWKCGKEIEVNSHYTEDENVFCSKKCVKYYQDLYADWI